MSREEEIEKIAREIEGFGVLFPYEAAKRIYKLGYRIVPPELKVMSDEEFSEIKFPNKEKVIAFRDNPDNEFGDAILEYKTIAAYTILYAKKSCQAQIASILKQIEEANK